MTRPNTRSPILVCSVPKAGTYLVAALLEKLGYINTQWHIGRAVWQDYAGKDLTHIRTHPERFTKAEAAANVIARIPPGAFAVSHLGPETVTKSLREKLRLIVVTRDLRTTIPAYCDWNYRTGRWPNKSGWKNAVSAEERLRLFCGEFGKQLYGEFSAIADWIGEQDVMIVPFEALRGDWEAAAQCDAARALAQVLGTSVDKVQFHLDEARSEETATKSTDGRSKYDDATWKRFSEWFKWHSFQGLNQKLGYALDGLASLRLSYLMAEPARSNCPICGGPQSRALHQRDRYRMRISVTQCEFCGFVFVSPRPSSKWFDEFYREKYWKVYSFHGFQDEARRSRIRCGQILSGISSRLPRKLGRTLDIGCGSGGMLMALTEMAVRPEIWGTDLSTDAVESCGKLGNFHIVQTDWRPGSSLPPGRFDLITMIHVAEHLHEPRVIFERLSEKLTDGGWLYVEVPNLASQRWIGDSFFHIAHVNYFTPETMARLMRSCGLEPIHCYHGLAKEWPWAFGWLARRAALSKWGSSGVEPATKQELEHIRMHTLRKLEAGRLNRTWLRQFIRKAKWRILKTWKASEQ